MGVVMSPSSGFCQSSKNREEEEIHRDWGPRAGNLTRHEGRKYLHAIGNQQSSPLYAFRKYRASTVCRTGDTRMITTKLAVG